MSSSTSTLFVPAPATIQSRRSGISCGRSAIMEHSPGLPANSFILPNLSPRTQDLSVQHFISRQLNCLCDFVKWPWSYWHCKEVSKEDKILIKSLQECKGYNDRQFITEFRKKGWTKNSMNWLPVKFGTVDKRPSSGRRMWSENVDTLESLLLSHEDKPQSHRTVREILCEAGGSIDHHFRGLFTKFCVSSAIQEKARSTADWSAQHAHVIFDMQFEGQ